MLPLGGRVVVVVKFVRCIASYPMPSVVELEVPANPYTEPSGAKMMMMMMMMMIMMMMRATMGGIV